MLESDIVSGNINASNGSVDGVYKIVYKQKDATLAGEAASAEKYIRLQGRMAVSTHRLKQPGPYMKWLRSAPL